MYLCFSTKTIASVFNHFALHRLHQAVTRTQHVDPSTAIKLHYKPKCPEELGIQCHDIVHNAIPDTSLDRFASNLEAKISKVLSQIH